MDCLRGLEPGRAGDDILGRPRFPRKREAFRPMACPAEGGRLQHRMGDDAGGTGSCGQVRNARHLQAQGALRQEDIPQCRRSGGGGGDGGDGQPRERPSGALCLRTLRRTGGGAFRIARPHERMACPPRSKPCRVGQPPADVREQRAARREGRDHPRLLGTRSPLRRNLPSGLSDV